MAKRLKSQKARLKALRKKYRLGEFKPKRAKAKRKTGTDLRTFYKKNRRKRGFKVSTYKYKLNPYFLK